MSKNIDTINLQALSKMLQVFPSIESDVKEEYKNTIKDLINNIKEKNKDDEFLYDLTNLYEKIILQLDNIKSDEEYLFFNFKRVLNIQEYILIEIIENRSSLSANQPIKNLLNKVKLLIEKDNRVLLTYLLEEPKRMKNIIKMMNINKILNQINEKIENYIENRKVING